MSPLQVLSWVFVAAAAGIMAASVVAFFYGFARLWMLMQRDSKKDQNLSRSEARYSSMARVGSPEYLKYLKIVGAAWLCGVLTAAMVGLTQIMPGLATPV